MKHEDAWSLLNDWIDGNLDTAQDREIRAHLAACSACRAEAEELRTLIARARELPSGIEPEHDLWSDIEAALESPEEHDPAGAEPSPGDETGRRPSSPGELLRRIASLFPTRKRLAFPALGFTAALAILIYILVLPQFTSGPSRFTGATSSRESVPRHRGTLEVLKALEAECLHAEQLFALAAATRPATSSRRILSSMSRDMRTIDRAIGEISEAWAENPRDATLTRRLIEAYQKRISLQKRMIRVTTLT